jgi:hypothetical protein
MSQRTEALRQSQKKYYETKLKTNPEYVAKRNQYNIEYYATMCEDKEWRDKRNKTQRTYSKEWRKRKRDEKLKNKIEQFKNELIDKSLN